MRIGITCPYDLFKGGGVQEHVLGLREELARRGHYARILTPQPRDFDGDFPDYVIPVGVSVTSRAFGGTMAQYALSTDGAQVDEVFERQRFDILHVHEPFLPFWGRQVVMRSPAANVATMHARYYDTMTAKTIATVVTPYTKPLLKHFDAFTSVAEVSTEYFQTLSTEPISIIPNAINVAKYNHAAKERRPSADNKTILFIGRLEPRKGVRYLISAFAELAKRRPSTRLLIAGSGPEELRLRNQVTELNVPRVEFDARFIPEDTKLDYLHRADLFSSPARYGEAFGIVLLEAMAADLPVVAGDNIGYQGVMQGRGALSLVNPRDSVDFARRLELLLYDEPLRQLWKDWARDYVKQFDWRPVADQYLKVYEQAIKNHESRAA